MIIKPITTAPGPPVWKAPPLETKRPAPIAPPLELSQHMSFTRRMLNRKADGNWIVSELIMQGSWRELGRKGRTIGRKNLHGNHLHMSSFQISVQLALIGFDNSYIRASDTELAAMSMFAKASRVNWVNMTMLLRIREGEAFTSKAHL